jgi:hypothetical protein
MNNPEPTWVKSSYSSQGNCVEVAEHDHRVMVRDTKDRPGPVLRFSPASWRRFAELVKRSLADPRPWSSRWCGAPLVS